MLSFLKFFTVVVQGKLLLAAGFFIFNRQTPRSEGPGVGFLIPGSWYSNGDYIQLAMIDYNGLYGLLLLSTGFIF